MTETDDLSFLDDPRVLCQLFPFAYAYGYPSAQRDLHRAQLSSYIEMEDGARLGCKFWVRDRQLPTILYFHGNGETVADYEWVAPLYLEKGINLFVVDYRGYGGSDGEPTFTNVMSDARAVLLALRQVLADQGLSSGLFVMGRSIGSIPACEVALHHQGDLCGLIIESGAANNFRYRWAEHRPYRDDVIGDDGIFLNKVKLRSVTIPTLIIHGRRDSIVPFSEGEELYTNAVAVDKRLLALPGGHNDLLETAMEDYFAAISEFVGRNRLDIV
ncbi:MAG: alpha/beta hydrolase [Actinobacteria bacterium]|mgnify:CR=1 FL=1|nr:alpha/beta hydrolase [Actinomycetota bacterium]